MTPRSPILALSTALWQAQSRKSKLTNWWSALKTWMSRTATSTSIFYSSSKKMRHYSRAWMTWKWLSKKTELWWSSIWVVSRSIKFHRHQSLSFRVKKRLQPHAAAWSNKRRQWAILMFKSRCCTTRWKCWLVALRNFWMHSNWLQQMVRMTWFIKKPATLTGYGSKEGR